MKILKHCVYWVFGLIALLYVGGAGAVLRSRQDGLSNPSIKYNILLFLSVLVVHRLLHIYAIPRETFLPKIKQLCSKREASTYFLFFAYLTVLGHIGHCSKEGIEFAPDAVNMIPTALFFIVLGVIAESRKTILRLSTGKSESDKAPAPAPTNTKPKSDDEVKGEVK